jgi:hypothetical protein
VLAKAKADMAIAQEQALTNPAKGAAWPQLSATYARQIQ